MKEWETLIKITDPISASLLEGRLQAEGIPVIVRAGEAAGAIYGLTTGPLAEIKILVPEEKMDKARSLLQQIEEEAGDTADDDESDESDELIGE